MNLRVHASDPSVAEKDSPVIHGALPAEEDTRTALEDLLDQVWRCEADWRLNDRIDLAQSLAGGRTVDRRAEGECN